MGTRSGGDGGGWPPDELPDLPPEWGAVVIPDDPSELAQEATRVRRELRREALRRRWRRRLHLPQTKPRRSDEPALGVPLLVIMITLIATLTSLFAISWPTRPQQPDLRPTAVTTTPAGTSGSTRVDAPPAVPGVPSATIGSPAASTPSVASPTGTVTPHALRALDGLGTRASSRL